jgi:hypothetical protein
MWVEADTEQQLLAVAPPVATPATFPPCPLLYYPAVKLMYHNGTGFTTLEFIPLDEFWQY